MRFIPITSILQSLILLVISLLVAIHDLRRRRAPDPLTLGGMASMLVLSGLQGRVQLLNSLYGVLLGCSLLLLARILTHNGLGLGDVKFGAFLGAGLGPRPILLALGLAAIIALTYAATCINKNGCGRDPRIPFVPFLAGGAALAWLAKLFLPGYLS